MNGKERTVYVVDGARTPFLKVKGGPNPLTASDLAVACSRPLLLRQNFSPESIEEVIVGCVGPAADEANIGRLIALRLGLPMDVMGWTVQRNCASGLQALDCAYLDIKSGRHDLVLAGGTECMSRAPLLFSEKASAWFASVYKGKDFMSKAEAFLKVKPGYFVPEIGLLKALSDPLYNMTMGETAEKVAYLFDVTRTEMDEYALRSQTLAKQGFEKGYFEEVVPLYDYQGDVFTRDTGIRDTSLEQLSQLKPSFDKPFGIVTAGNSSQVTDGAAFVILASETAVEKYDLPILGKIVDTAWAALDPTIMGLGPAYAIAKLLHKMDLKMTDIDYWEINEAFASQVLACVRLMQDKEYCQQYLDLNYALGTIDMNRLNVDGGAIAIGHPVGASGTRLALHMLHVLKRNRAGRGIVSLCIGGGQGGAMLVER